MTGRRKPLCVVLLLVVLLSTMYVWTPGFAQSGTGHTSPAALESSEVSATDVEKDINIPEMDTPSQTAVYPSSSVDGPRPLSEPNPDVNSPPMLDHHYITQAQALGSPPYNGSDVRVSVLDYGLDMGQPDLVGSQFVQPSGTFAGWPTAFDPMSMGIWLREEKYEGTWYANTTRKGQPPFEVTHYILVDGRSDFGESELLEIDPSGTSTSDSDGSKKDFDLTNLYVTHDEKFWYFGFPVATALNSNITYGLLIDVDNETSGTTSVPEGKLVNTNTTHTGYPADDNAVNDVAVSPDGTKIATTSSDKHVKVWAMDGTRLFDFSPADSAGTIGHTSRPFGLAWSPDGMYLASRDKSKVFIWNIQSGSLHKSISLDPARLVLDISPPDDRYPSNIAFSPDGSWLAVAGSQRIAVFAIATGNYIGNATLINSGTLTSIAFNPTNPATPQIVVGVDSYGLDSNTVRIYNLDASTLVNNPNPTRANSIWNSTTSVLLGAHTGKIITVSWSPDGARIVSTSKDFTVKLWEPSWGGVPRMSSGLHGGWVFDASWERTAPWRFATVSKSTGTPPKAPLRLWDYNGNSLGYFDLNRTTFAVDWTNSGELVTASMDLSARIWSTSGFLQEVLVANKPDFAVMINAGLNYSLKDLKWVKVVYNGTFYNWDGSQWAGGHELTKAPINGTQAFFGIDDIFVELGVPVSVLGNPSGISVEMFSVTQGKDHAQDTVPQDGGVFDMNGDGYTDRESINPSRPALDFSQVATPLSAFEYVPVTYYEVDTVAIPSQSGEYHFGYHPSQRLAQIFGSLGLLVVDPFQNGTYERVYLDMDRDTCESNHVFDGRDVWVDKTRPVATCNKVGDSTPDISAGMIYFIADGVNDIPYTNRYSSINGLEKAKTPGNGELVAFAGEFRMDPDTNDPLKHGTEVASIIASRGIINPSEMKGIAAGVKLIPIMNAINTPADVISSWYFAVEGYDGTPGTGDEAQIVVNPFSYPRTKDDGYDQYSRTADYLSTSYSAGRTVIFSPAGEEGFGYGSIASPAASPGIITVGRTVDGTLVAGEGPSVHYSNLAFGSSRGPTVSGFPKPDLVAIGNSATDEPIIYGSDGRDAYSRFGLEGSEVSAAIAAGVGALLLEAAKRLGTDLTAGDVSNYLMSGAENLGYDVLLQGAGFLNASRSMRLLLGNKGGASVQVSPSNWVPGFYKAAKPDSFTKLLFPGEGDQSTFTIGNRDTRTLDLAVSGDILTKSDGYVFTNKTTLRNSNEIFLWINRSGVFVENVSVFPPEPKLIAPPLPQQVWDDAESMKISAYGLFDNLIVPSGTDSYANLYCYDIFLNDWTMDPFGLGYPSTTYPWELNTIDRLGQTANVLEARVHHPSTEIHDALVIRLTKHLASESCGRTNLEWRFNIDFFERVPWSVISLDKTSVSLNAGTSTTFVATVTVPSDMAMGSYEAAIYVYDSYNDHEITIPVLLNVGARTPNFRFGGNLPSTGLNDVSRIYGGRDLTLLGANVRYPYLGDWRFFYVWLPDEGLNVAGASIKMVVQLNWTVKPSDIDMVAFTPASAADTASQFASMRFGPKSVREVASSEIEPKPKFKTLSNESQDYISFQLNGGLNVLALHQMILNGDKPYEIFAGSGMWWRVPREVRVATQQLSGSVGGSAMLSNTLFDGLRVDAVGPAITSKNSSELIKQDWQDWMRALPWGQALAKGSYSYCIQLKKVLILKVHLMGLPDVTDLDLGLFRDQNDDCKVDEATETTGDFCTGRNCAGGVPKWAYDADGDADETIEWTKPEDGYYIIKVLGFDVPGGAGHFDLDVEQTLDTGTGYWVPEAPPPEKILIGTKPVLPPFNIVGYSMAWDFPGDQEDGNYSGAVRFGTSTAAGIVIVPAVVILDRQAPIIDSFSVTSLGKLVNATNPTLTNDPRPTLVVSIIDRQMGSLDRDTFRMALDEVDVTPLIRVTVNLENSPFVIPPTVGPWGRWRGDVKYEVLNPLSPGIHTLYVAIGDEARNYIHANYTFTIDVDSPPLSLSGPPLEYLRQNTTTIQGITEPGAYILVGGQWLLVDASGQFSIPVSLEEGNNVFDVTATRWFKEDKTAMIPANTVTMQKSYVFDKSPPVIIGVTTDPPVQPVNAQTVRLTGLLSDEIAPSTPLANYSMLMLEVNGVQVSVSPDGSFSTIVPLVEGQNSFVFSVDDPAGNNITSMPYIITRDTIAPVIQVSGVPERVEEDRVTVTITSEPGLRVTVNGFDAQEGPSGTYTRTIGLSGGSNTLVIAAQDSARNMAEQRVVVEYAAPAGLGSLLFGPSGGSLGIAVILLIVIVVVIVVFFSMHFIRRGRGGVEEEGEVETAEEMVHAEELEQAEKPGELEEMPHEAPKPMPAVPEKRPEPKVPEETAKPASTLVVYRITRAKAALDEGKISKKVYEQNLASMGLSAAEADRILAEAKEAEKPGAGAPSVVVQPATEPPSAPAKVDEKSMRLKAAYDSGKIDKETYLRNLELLGVSPPAEIVKPAAEPKESTKEDKIRALRKALEEGRISQEVYEQNVRRIEQG